MRELSVIIIALSLSAGSGAALALQPADTMGLWKHSSAKERTEVLGRILGPSAPDAIKIRKCLDETAEVPGHTDLAIGEVAKACAAAKDAGQPV